MRAFLVTSRGVGEVADVPAPTPGEGQAVVTIARAGICGTDVPIVAVFLLMQRYWQSGLTAGSVKA